MRIVPPVGVSARESTPGYRIALHEAGHVVTGLAVGGLSFGAYVDLRTRGGKAYTTLPNAKVDDVLILLTGGLAAARLHGAKMKAADALSDAEESDTIAENAWTASEDFERAADLVRQESPDASGDDVREAVMRATGKALEIINANWGLVEAVADYLYLNQGISGERVRELVRENGLRMHWSLD